MMITILGIGCIGRGGGRGGFVLVPMPAGHVLGQAVMQREPLTTDRADEWQGIIGGGCGCRGTCLLLMLMMAMVMGMMLGLFGGNIVIIHLTVILLVVANVMQV